MGHAERICVSAHSPIRVVVSQQECSGRAWRIDWKGQVTSTVAQVSMWNLAAIEVIANDLAGGIHLIGVSRACPRHCECRDCPVRANEGRLRLVAESYGANENFIIINSQWDRIQGASDILINKIRVDQLVTMKCTICSILVLAYDMPFNVNAPALSQVTSVIGIDERVAEVA